MPDPDLPPIVLKPEQIEKAKGELPALPNIYREAWQSLSLDISVVNTLLTDQKVADLILNVQKSAGDSSAKRISNWFASAVDPESDNTSINLNQDNLTELSRMVEKNELSSTSAKDIFNQLIAGTDKSPREIAEEKNLLQVSDEGEIIKVVEQVLSDPSSQKAVEDIKAGNDKAIGFLVGQVMKQSAGKANPALAQKLIRERL